MQHYIGPKGFSIHKSSITPQQQQQIKNDLMAKPAMQYQMGAEIKTFPVYRESTKKLYIPRFYGIQQFGKPQHYTIKDGDDIHLSFQGDLRDFQHNIIDAYFHHIHEHDCALLDIPCGFGKTVCALNIISRLAKKTLVIVHKDFLLQQWKERIQEFLPDARIGKIQGPVVDIDDKDIVIGMLQTLSMKALDPCIFESFGLTVVDETHHMGAEVFSNALFAIVTKHMLGLSATMKRKDGLTKIFKMFLGEVAYTMKRNTDEDDLTIQQVFYDNQDDEFSEEILNYRGQTQYSAMIKKICEFNPRSEAILRILKDLCDDSKNRQIMILAHNKSLLEYLYNAVEHRQYDTVGYYVGGMKQNQLKLSESKRIILGTYAMAEEALDIKTLSCLVLATPRSDVTQAVGRILRMKHEQTIVVDIIDQHKTFKNQSKKRESFYKRNRYTIIQCTYQQYPHFQKLDYTTRRKTPVKTEYKCLIEL
jgi:superfamily II DNA or RNA helicase